MSDLHPEVDANGFEVLDRHRSLELLAGTGLGLKRGLGQDWRPDWTQEITV